MESLSPGVLNIIFIALIFVVFFVFIIRPQRKKEQQKAQMVNELKKGDKVITIGGIHGTIVQLGETSVTLEIDKSARLRVQKSAIDRLEKES